MQSFFQWIAKTDRFGLFLCRFSIFLVFFWIGLLKFAHYEAESIVPFVANSPFMSWLYHMPAEYLQHLSHEGQVLTQAQINWHIQNNTYGYSYGLGVVEISFALLIMAHYWSPKLGFLGALLSFLTPLMTFSFLIFTPETWVHGAGYDGFPFLSGAGRLVLKDAMMMAAAWMAMTDSAKTILKKENVLNNTADVG
ncbi:reactive chlorine resistance membrane protein RclC [Suttonella ornithocola]|uniref:Inner membrane protein ykgB n=1 Tax=Suttonella ornithocola TaxID=279832 RepID=A0A380MSD6_9GAMM|nr:reactive chlorine resistance membrane protein RclC [Suttonella ornithocola]SUO94631.1 Inner membrane protein ykgB [Suttonella ornithocola]